LPSEIPDTRYARADGGAIAYQSFGEGERNLVVVFPFVSHVEMSWEHPPYGEFMDRMAEIGRVTVFDKRGNGLSDALPEGESLEQRADDILAVMDAVGAERASLFGISEGAAMAALVAATRPERVDSLVLYGGIVRMREGEDFYSGAGWHVIAEEMLSGIEEAWGEGISLTALAPGRLGDERFRRWWGRFERAAAGPKMARDAFELDMQLDVRSVLSAITCPTLVLHRTHDVIPMEQSHYLASHIPDARMVELEGENHWPWLDDTEAVADGDRGVPHRRPAPPRARPHPGHRPVHRHRGLHPARGRAGRRGLARGPARARQPRPRAAPAPQRARGQGHRRRLPGHLRRPRPRGALRPGDHRGGPAAGRGGPGRVAHGRVRAVG
jgi:pimeloyl-ACP methyl ester carboxylesterase